MNMQSKIRTRLLALVVSGCLGAPAALAEAPLASLTPEQAKLNGYWASPPPTISHETAVHPGQPNDGPPDPEPSNRLVGLLQPWALTIHQKYVQLAAARNALSLEAPTLDNMCLPVAIPSEGSAAYGFPLQILVTPTRVMFLMELDHQMRIIRISGHHSTDPQTTWYGDSIGHWEGSTLVVDTIGFNDRTEIQQFPGGYPHTAAMHTIERYTVHPDGKQVDVQWTYEDPGALKGPFYTHKTFLRGEPYQEFVNSENNVEFPCPTAEAGTSYRKLTLKNLDDMLKETAALKAKADSAPK